MGSLMAGWDSTISPLSIERNKSLTKEEIEAFWKIHKESQHGQQDGTGSLKKNFKEGDDSKKPQSSPNSPRFVLRGNEYPIDVDKACHMDDWWTRSNWAFLNESPVEEETNKAKYNYTSQFHVALNKHLQAH
ncbi:hypothetical protein L1049_012610 [Liquidambar formosana]|uniref:Uncharacterized protein n=1 Tax=Liquidambar formosana TaxID=63359 RepID=A0AAP0N7E6_LIQFO